MNGFGKLPNYIKRIARDYDLDVIDQFHSGHSGALVYRASNGEQEYVLKAALSGTGRKEIEENINGYKICKEFGINEIVPDILDIIEDNEAAAIIMEYLGDSFYDLSKKSKDPIKMYKQVGECFSEIVYKTLRKDDKSREMIRNEKVNLLEKYSRFLIPNHVLDPSYLCFAYLTDVEILSPEYSAFGCYDFTPEDVFLTDQGLKFPDPKRDMIGCSILSLAAFAGVCRDSYELPGSEEGYFILKDVAVNEIGPLLGLDKAASERLFYFGRATQLSRSSKVRIHTDFKRAKHLARMSVDYLGMFGDKNAVSYIRKCEPLEAFKTKLRKYNSGGGAA